MNHDLNIWDRVGWETEYAEEGWSISVYEIPSEGSPYGSGEFLAELALSEDEARALTLGKMDGDYTPDSDFWLDLDTFLVTYKNIPIRVKAFLASLKDYNKEGDNNDLLSLWQELGAHYR